MAIVVNSQSFAAGASGTVMQSAAGQFQEAMDSVILGMGRDVTVHLPPSKSRCPTQTCRFNDTYQKFIGPDGQLCRTCGGQGYFLEPRQTVYLANIRWINNPLANTKTGGEATPAGRVYEGDVRTKMVAAAFNDIRNCIGAEIDGIPVKLIQQPRYTGFGGNLYYVIAFWEETNKKTNV